MSPVSWGDIFTLLSRGARIMELRHPLTARLDQILAAVHNLDVALGVHAGDVAGAKPPVGSPAVLLLRRVVVTCRHPRPANLELTGCLTVPRSFCLVGAHDAQL